MLGICSGARGASLCILLCVGTFYKDYGILQANCTAAAPAKARAGKQRGCPAVLFREHLAHHFVSKSGLGSWRRGSARPAARKLAALRRCCSRAHSHRANGEKATSLVFDALYHAGRQPHARAVNLAADRASRATWAWMYRCRTRVDGERAAACGAVQTNPNDQRQMTANSESQRCHGA